MRSMLACGMVLMLTGAAAAQTAAPSRATPVAEDAFLGTATYRLYDGDAPGAAGKADLDVPTLTVFRPHPRTGNGTAIVIAPGGAYLGLAANLEGRQVADFFAARGVTAFVLKYRLGRTYLYPTPLRDAQRAIRFVRARAAEFGIIPDRIGMMGFSAGGHLTASAATFVEPGRPDAPDPIERVGSRPDFIVLGYPWLNAMWKNPAGVLSVLLGAQARAGAVRQLRAGTRPTRMSRHRRRRRSSTTRPTMSWCRWRQAWPSTGRWSGPACRWRCTCSRKAGTAAASGWATRPSTSGPDCWRRGSAAAASCRSRREQRDDRRAGSPGASGRTPAHPRPRHLQGHDDRVHDHREHAGQRGRGLGPAAAREVARVHTDGFSSSRRSCSPSACRRGSR